MSMAWCYPLAHEELINGYASEGNDSSTPSSHLQLIVFGEDQGLMTHSPPHDWILTGLGTASSVWVPDYTDHIMSRTHSFTDVLHILYLLLSFSFLSCDVSWDSEELVLFMDGHSTFHHAQHLEYPWISIFNHSVKERLLWLSLRVDLVCRHTHKYLGERVWCISI